MEILPLKVEVYSVNKRKLNLSKLVSLEALTTVLGLHHLEDNPLLHKEVYSELNLNNQPWVVVLVQFSNNLECLARLLNKRNSLVALEVL